MKKQIARELLKIKAVFLRPEEPFTWASGIKSPIYCDNRLVLSYPEVRSQVELGLIENIKANFPECELLAGTSTAGIPHAAICADRMDLPMCYVRSSGKDHGRQNKIEGVVVPGQKVVVVEDLISTGGSVMDVVTSLREAGAEVLGIAAIFTYNFASSAELFEKNGVKAVTLTDYPTLAAEAAELGYIPQSAVAKLNAFSANPRDISWMNA